jgi:hypothetical protein
MLRVCALHEQEHTCCKLIKKFKYANLTLEKQTISVHFPEGENPLLASW